MSKADQDKRLARYQDVSTVPLLITGFVYLASFIAFQADGEPATAILFSGAWIIFMIDYAIQFLLAPRKWRFVVGHPMYVLALVFPPLRIWLLVTVAIRFVRDDNYSLKNRVGLASLVAVGLIVTFGGLLTLLFEHGEAGANIETYGESLWWASVTLTSVGYGDFVPVTVGGRSMGTLVFSTGVAALAVVTATVVGMFTPTDSGKQPQAPEAPQAPQEEDITAKDPQLEAVMAKLDEINTRLAAIERSSGKNLGAASTTLSYDRRTVESDKGSAESQSHGDAQ